MLNLLTGLVILLVLLATIAAVRLLWASYKLYTCPSIEPIEVAHPETAECFNGLIQHVTSIAGLNKPPRLYIRRAALPNAFIVASIFKSDLFMTDELLEDCNNKENGLDKLTHIICHEIAHIKRHDAIALGLLTYAEQWSDKLQLNGLKHLVQRHIQTIEDDTNKVADNLFQQLKD